MYSSTGEWYQLLLLQCLDAKSWSWICSNFDDESAYFSWRWDDEDHCMLAWKLQSCRYSSRSLGSKNAGCFYWWSVMRSCFKWFRWVKYSHKEYLWRHSTYYRRFKNDTISNFQVLRFSFFPLFLKIFVRFIPRWRWTSKKSLLQMTDAKKTFEIKKFAKNKQCFFSPNRSDEIIRGWFDRKIWACWFSEN